MTTTEEVEELIKEFRLAEHKKLIGESEKTHERVQELLREIDPESLEEIREALNR